MKTLALALTALLAPELPSLASHPWGRWQTGAWVETETRRGPGPAALARDQLVRVEDGSYVLANTLFLDGNDVESERAVPWALGGYAHAQASARVVGKEAVVVEGQRYECEVWEARNERAGKAYLDRTWIADGVAFPLRKQSAGPQSSMTLTLAALRDYVTVDGRKLACARYTGRGKSGGASLEVTQWESEHVPGGMVRAVTRMRQGGRTTVVERKVVAFHGGIQRRR